MYMNVPHIKCERKPASQNKEGPCPQEAWSCEEDFQIKWYPLACYYHIIASVEFFASIPSALNIIW